jgi:putative ATPase
MKDLGFGEGYVYSHDRPGHFFEADNLPEKIKDERFYEPGELGSEQAIRERLLGWWGERYRRSPRD